MAARVCAIWDVEQWAGPVAWAHMHPAAEAVRVYAVMMPAVQTVLVRHLHQPD